MISVEKLSALPSKSIINESLGKIDYSDTYRITISKNHDYSIDYITALFFTSFPAWVKQLLSIRNFLVKYFNLKSGEFDKLKEPDKSVYFEAGSKAVIFTVHSRNENEIVMAENDKHLYFRTSVMIEKSPGCECDYLYSMTIVRYNNFGGRFYFFFVKPFHRLIIKTLLKVVSEKLG